MMKYKITLLLASFLSLSFSLIVNAADINLPTVNPAINPTTQYSDPFSQQLTAKKPTVIRDKNAYVTLCYHDFIDVKLTPNLKVYPDTLTRDRLVEHFNWIKQQGYHPISFQQILDAKAGKKPLPSKAVLLSFDDGYSSFYYTVYPLLKLYNYPAVLAIVGNWLNPDSNGMVQYGKNKVSHERFITWPQLQEIQRDGLVEIASHTYNSHYGINANSYKNEQPAITTPAYDLKTHQYETLTQYQQRVHHDFIQSRNQMIRHGITPPRIIVWPYGAYNKITIDIAHKLGMPYTFSLDEAVNSIFDSGNNVKRYLIDQELQLSHLQEILQGEIPTHPQQRVIHVDLDYIYDPDPHKMNKNMDILIDRIKNAGINTVYLQAFADPDGDGVANALYFPNSYLPVRADIFNRVSWQLTTRSGVNVYAWMPVLAFDLGKNYQYITDSRFNAPDPIRYQRLSPFSAKNRQIINGIYQELGAYAKFSGLLFHDDAFLTDFEDNSPSAIKQYQQWGLGDSITAIQHDPQLMKKWTQYKTQYLTNFTLQLANSTRHYLSSNGTPLLLARNIYAMPILNSTSQQWFAQDLANFDKAYDYIAVMAMPYMEKAKHPHQWLKTLAHITQQTVAPEKIVFELQAKDWRTNTHVPSAELAQQMKIIKQAGIISFGYYPDDFVQQQPDINVLRPVFSNNSQLKINL